MFNIDTDKILTPELFMTMLSSYGVDTERFILKEDFDDDDYSFGVPRKIYLFYPKNKIDWNYLVDSITDENLGAFAGFYCDIDSFILAIKSKNPLRFLVHYPGKRCLLLHFYSQNTEENCKTTNTIDENVFKDVLSRHIEEELVTYFTVYYDMDYVKISKKAVDETLDVDVTLEPEVDIMEFSTDLRGIDFKADIYYRVLYDKIKGAKYDDSELSYVDKEVIMPEEYLPKLVGIDLDGALLYKTKINCHVAYDYENGIIDMIEENISGEELNDDLMLASLINDTMNEIKKTLDEVLDDIALKE